MKKISAKSVYFVVSLYMYPIPNFVKLHVEKNIDNFQVKHKLINLYQNLYGVSKKYCPVF